MSVHPATKSVEQEQLNPSKILQTALAFWQAKVLLTAAELDIFTELAKQPLSANALSERLGLHERGRQDFLDALVSMGMLERDHDLYRNSKEAEYYLDAAKPSYIGGFLLMTNARLYPTWGRLTEALKTGKPQNEAAHNEDLFAELYSDGDRLKQFLSAMTGISLPTARLIAEKFDWSKYKTFVDVGAAQGSLPVEIARKHPHLTGHGFDLPAVEPVFTEYVSRQSLASRLRFEPGDFFKDKLPSADVIVMGHILHDWDLEQKLTLVRKAHDALNPGGALIVYDAMIDPERTTNTFGLLCSLNMLVETHGGFDYTTADCIKWFKQSGFDNVEVTELSPTHSMCTGVK